MTVVQSSHELATTQQEFVPSKPVARILKKLRHVASSSEDGQWTARCPAHDDENPSLSISQGVDGRALLKCHAGCTLEKVLDALDLNTADLFVRRAAEATPDAAQPPEAPAAEVSHFQQKWEDCRLPVDSAALLPLVNQFGVDAEVLYRIGVGLSNNCWIFPERDATGAIIGLAARGVDGSKACVPGSRRGLTIPDDLDEVQGVVLLVEGASDVAACLQLGLPAVGRPSNRGGAGEIAKLLPDREVLVVGENDEGEDGRWPGKEGARTTAEALSKAWEKPVGYALPPDGVKDVREFVRKERDAGAENDEIGRRLLEHLTEAIITVDRKKAAQLVIELERTGRAKDNVIVSFAGEEVLIDEVKSTNCSDRERLARNILTRIPDAGLTADDIEVMLLDKVRAMREEREDDFGCDPGDLPALLRRVDKQIAAELERIPSEVIEEAEAMLADPNLIEIIRQDIATIGVVGEERLALTLYIVGTSRLLKNPLAAIVQGPSSSGKSYVIASVGSLFPKAATLPATDITTNALYYGAVDSLVHRLVMAGERPRQQDDQRAEATRALRELISAGVLRKLVPRKTSSGEIRTESIERHGPIAYVESTTANEIFDEDANRCLLLSTDETATQSRRILEATAKMAEGQLSSEQRERVIQKHHAAQLLLRRFQVTTPYASQIATAMPAERPEARRAIDHVFQAIGAVALLHQKQRVIKDDFVFATVEDYAIARELLIDPMGRLMGGKLPDAAANLLQRLRERYLAEPFTTTRATKEDGTITDSKKMAGYLKTLADHGAVELFQEGRGSRPHTWRLVPGQVPFDEVWLPASASVERTDDTALVEPGGDSGEPGTEGSS